MKIKIGRHEYEISDNDVFMDNGKCVQLLTQSKENVTWGYRPKPVLSQRAIKEIAVYDQVKVEHPYGVKVSVFSLSIGIHRK